MFPLLWSANDSRVLVVGVFLVEVKERIAADVASGSSAALFISPIARFGGENARST